MTYFQGIIEGIGQATDMVGVAAIALGILVATLHFFKDRLRGGTPPVEAFRNYRHGIERAILLGLEILVAADIIRTVAIEPTFRSVGILVIIVLIRTFLSTTLELELEGRWPWQSSKKTSQE